jgi:hypothetical protein
MREPQLRNTNEHIEGNRSEYVYTYDDYLRIFEEVGEENIYL